MTRQTAEKLALDLVQDILRRHGPDIRRHNQIGDTPVIYRDVFDAARSLYKQATARHPIYGGYFDLYLKSMVLKDCITILPMGEKQ